MDILRLVITGIYVVAAIAIIAVVLLQEGKSAGLGGLVGGASEDSYWSKNKKHTLEGRFEKWTKIVAALFVILALILSLI